MIDLNGIAFQVFDDVRHHQLVLHAGELEGNLLRVAERVRHRDRVGGVIGRCGAEAAPVAEDLFEQFLALPFDAFAMKADDLFQGFGGPHVLLAVQENLHQLIPRLRRRKFFPHPHHRPEAGDELVVFAEDETFHTVGQTGDRFRLLQRGGLQDAVAFLHIRLAPPTVGRERVHIVMRLAKLEPLQPLGGGLLRIDADDLLHRPTPPLAIGGGRFP